MTDHLMTVQSYSPGLITLHVMSVYSPLEFEPTSKTVLQSKFDIARSIVRPPTSIKIGLSEVRIQTIR